LRRQILDIGRDSVWYLVATIWSSLTSFVAVPIFTRVLVPSEYGVYSLIAGTILLVGNFCSIWLAISIVRFHPVYEKEDRMDEFYSTIYHYFPHVLAAVLLVALPLVALFLPLGENRAAICFGIAVFPLYWMFRVSQGLTRARRFSKFYAIQAILADAGRYLVGAALVAWVGLGVKGIFMGWLGALVLVVIMQMFVLSVMRYFHWDRYSPTLERELLHFGLPLIAVNLLGSALSMADRYIIGILKGTSEVGLYAVVYSLTTAVMFFLISFIELGAIPVVTRTYENEGEKQAVALIRTLTRYFLLVIVPSAVGMWVLRTRIMMVITSAKYIPAQNAILPLVIGIALSQFAWLPAISFNLKKRTRLLMWPVLIAAVFNIALNFALVPFYGYMGAAWATLLSYIVYVAVAVVLARRLMEWDFPWGMLAKTSAASVVMGAALYWLNRLDIHGIGALALLIAIGTVIYFCAILAFGGFSRQELTSVLALGKRLPLVRNLTGRGAKGGKEE
jgi:O-antigen/teichoic acid export membrane protein